MTKIIKGLKFRIYPKPEHKDLLARSFGCNRFVWNRCLAKNKELYESFKEEPNSPRPKVDFRTFNDYLNELKNNNEWLYEVSAVSLQQTTRDLTCAFTKCFRDLKKGKLSFPKFKKKTNRNSFRLTKVGFQIRDNKLYIVKSKTPIKVNWSRELPSEPTSCTISQDPDGKYYVSFNVLVDPHLTNGVKQTGIDLGISDFITDSDGNKYTNFQFLFNSLKALKRAQQSISRKVKGSKNRNKARIKVAKIHKRISNQRDDYLHKLSRSLVNENQVIGLESLKISNMVRNRHLSRSIIDASWGRFKRYLAYKASESHCCNLLLMHPFYPSSKTCSHCGSKYEGLKLSERSWMCNTCYTLHDRDVNAAKNILVKALESFKLYSPDNTWLDKPVICGLE